MTQRVLVVLCLVVGGLSCAARQKQSRYEERDRLTNEIIQLDGEIREYRRKLGLAPRPDAFFLQKEARGHGNEIPWCSPPDNQSDQCSDVCDLGRYICDAKDEICRIANKLGGDDTWALGKCRKARASCREARKRCCDCR